MNAAPRRVKRPATPALVKDGTLRLIAPLELPPVDDEPLPLAEGDGVNPTGPVGSVGEAERDAATEVADWNAALAALGFDWFVKRTVSIICKTPFSKMISGTTIWAVVFPLVTKVPVELVENDNPSPAADVKLALLDSAWKSLVYCVVALSTWFCNSSFNSVLFEPTREDTLANAALVGAKKVKPWVVSSVSRRPAELRSEVAFVRLFAARAVLSAPGGLRTALISNTVMFWMTVLFKTCVPF